MWWKKKNVCAYWDCKTAISDDELLCAQHKEKRNAGFIDRCPKCQRFKDIMYHLCQDCYVGRSVKPLGTSTREDQPKQKFRIEYSEEWSDISQIRDKSYVYIVGFDDGSVQVGQTRDMAIRLAELSESRETVTEKNTGAKFEEPQQSDVGRSPRLDFMEVTDGEKAGDARIAQLNRMMESNPGQIEAMIYEFHQHMREFGFEVD
ncbi:MAG: hypothetical protein CL876_03685 [Dehalococcoidales bacterium]|nr:hypothetical protein [Dehalococcoidales bacterium]